LWVYDKTLKPIPTADQVTNSTKDTQIKEG
jgi:hypothetical protein